MTEKTSERVVREEVNFIGQGDHGNKPVQLVTEVKRYSFKNIGKSMFYVTPPHSKNTKALHPGEMRDDFTEAHRNKILGSTLYKLGQVVEVCDTEIPIDNPNALSDKQLESILLGDNDDIKEHIIMMDSVFAVDRVREKILERDMPSHLVGYCDSRIGELKAKYEEENVAPIDTFKGGQ